MEANMTSRDSLMKDSAVTFRTSQGTTIPAVLLHLGRHRVVMEIQSAGVILQMSEMLQEFNILIEDRPIYSGRAVVTSIINAGTGLICQASLEDEWRDLAVLKLSLHPHELRAGFDQFIRSWQKVYRILPEYKIVVADVQTFLWDLRLWLDQVELGIRAAPPEEQARLTLEIAQQLRPTVSEAMGSMFARFEAVAGRIEEDLHPMHRAFSQRQLHPLLLCAPFINRTYVKPLGYAGDYEMMNMIVRNGLEGDSLYAMLVNAYLLDQIGPQAVRNRVDYLQGKIVDESSRMARLGRQVNIYCLACGPAWEARNFIAESPLADQAHFTLLDFNAETLAHTGEKMDEIRKRHQRRTDVKFVRNSMQNLLRARGRAADEPAYDLIYCSGLYDYLNDRLIKAINTYLYDRLTPGGLLVVGNFAPSTPVRNFIEHFLEWFLIYRDARQLAVLAPEQADPEACKVVAEPTGANIFLEVRKPL
jgi:extracellular factor (EF) 3-hydroxypalmitic acid methyl ester biosynthesis protein